MNNFKSDETILLALYAEWISDTPDFRRVNQVNLQMEPEVFLWGLMRLKKVGYIDGVSWQPETANQADKVVVLCRDNISITKEGIERAEELAEIGKKRRAEALKVICGIFRDLGIAAFSGLVLK